MAELSRPEPAAASAVTAAGGEAVALVLGLSIHGLAIARALSRSGVEVYALEQARRQPSVSTRYAKVLFADGINTDRAARILLDKRSELPPDRPVVLYPGSDNMVRSIAKNWDRLREHYLLSWASSAGLVERLIDKSNLQAVCEERGLLYPRSHVVRGPEDVGPALADVGLPALVKPIRSLSRFKALNVSSPAELEDVVRRYGDDLPFLVQQWVEGEDDSLYFCSMVMVDGEPAATFTGRKLEAFPAGTGVGTVVESCMNDTVTGLSRRFVDGLGLSGPIAIEFKRAPSGEYWLIEPNVGRTEYSVDLIIQAGLNFPLIEYAAAQGSPLPPEPSELEEVVWYDSERDPLCYVRRMLGERTLRPRGKRPVFPYAGHGDPRPLAGATRRLVVQAVTSAAGRAVRLLKPEDKARIERVGDYASLPQEARDFLETYCGGRTFMGAAWFTNYEHNVGRFEGAPYWTCVRGPDDVLYGVIPVVHLRDGRHMVLRVMSNYYTPYVSIPFAFDRADAPAIFASAIAQLKRESDRIDLAPVAADDPLSEFLRRERPVRGAVWSYSTTNWFQHFTGIESYYRARPSQLRSTIQRKGRALERMGGVEFRVVDNLEGLESAIEDYFTVYDRSWKPREPFPEFIRRLMVDAARDGTLRLGILRIEGQPAAAQMWLVRDGIAFIYKLAYDKRYAKNSVGTLLTWHLMQHVAEADGVHKFDYLTGNDPYKREWMDEFRILSRVAFPNLLRPLGLSYLARQWVADANVAPRATAAGEGRA